METLEQLKQDLDRLERVEGVMHKHSEHISTFEWRYMEAEQRKVKDKIKELEKAAK